MMGGLSSGKNTESLYSRDPAVETALGSGWFWLGAGDIAGPADVLTLDYFESGSLYGVVIAESESQWI